MFFLHSILDQRFPGYTNIILWQVSILRILIDLFANYLYLMLQGFLAKCHDAEIIDLSILYSL